HSALLNQWVSWNLVGLCGLQHNNAIRSPQRPWFVVENAQVGKLLSEAGPVRRVDPGNDARAMLLIVGGAPTGEHCFTGGQLPDRHRLHVARMLLGEIAVKLFVVLA